MMRRSARIGWLVLLLAACGPDVQRIDDAKPGAAAALMALKLPDQNGTMHALEHWRGKIMVVNYWATWCAPCKVEMPAFAAAQAKYASKGVQFVGISIDSAENLRDFQKHTPVNYPLLVAEMKDMQTAIDLGDVAAGVPFTVILDRQGAVYSTRLGRLPEDILERGLHALLKE